MPVQLGAPAVVRINFRQFDESGADVGPLDLTLPEYRPLKLVLHKPSGVVVVKLEADLTLTDLVNGAAEWRTAANDLDTPGYWKAQPWAGNWPSAILLFEVFGPNLSQS